MTATAGIVLESVTKSFRGARAPALDSVSLSIRPGEAFGIIGPNGAGKTTLLGCLLGLLRPHAGKITIDGQAPDDLAIRAVTGYLPERLVFDRWMSGRDFLRFHHELAGREAGSRDDETVEALAAVGLGAEAAARSIRQYSRGMLQRLGLAQALLARPRYLFLDEPASGVDPGGVVLFRRLLTEWKARGTTIVLNSHQLQVVERVCDRVALLDRGRVQTIEVVEAGAKQARVLRVRVLAGAAVDRERATFAAAGAGASLIEFAVPDLRFEVDNDEGAARLLAALVAAGVPVVEAAPEEGRLERLFSEDSQ